jgi:hypothetical protein
MRPRVTLPWRTLIGSSVVALAMWLAFGLAAWWAINRLWN